jgi:hypothetical protein
MPLAHQDNKSTERNKLALHAEIVLLVFFVNLCSPCLLCLPHCSSQCTAVLANKVIVVVAVQIVPSNAKHSDTAMATQL